MANKRYDQFTAQTPDNSRILLHGNPSTGDLHKCTLLELLNLSLGGCAAANYASSTYTGAGTVTHLSYAFPSDYFSGTSKGIEIGIWGNTLNATNAPTIQVVQNSTQIAFTSTGGTGGFRMNWNIGYNTSSQTSLLLLSFRGGAITNQASAIMGSVTWTGIVTFYVKTITSGAGSVRIDGCFIRSLSS